ncbi:MAG: biotin transport system permease protein [Pseudorhodobacter sp.]|jgi:biotin transport system permease protein
MLTLTSPIETPLHRLRAGWKLAALAIATLLIWPLRDLALIGVAMLGVAGIYGALGWGFARHGARMLRPLWPFMLILGLWHGWTGEWAAGLGVAGRMITAIALANLVTMTTRLDDLIAALEWLTAPLARLGLSPKVLAVSVALVVRFTPVLMDKVTQLMQAWRARSARRANWRVVLPAVLIALDDADHVAEALRARGGL